MGVGHENRLVTYSCNSH